MGLPMHRPTIVCINRCIGEVSERREGEKSSRV
jgi:hypothetical protein